MAKKQASDQVGEPQAMQAEPPQSAPAAVKKFQMTLNCPTPIAHKSAVVAGVDASAAKLRFFEINGISATEHPIDIVQVADDVAETVPVNSAVQQQPEAAA